MFGRTLLVLFVLMWSFVWGQVQKPVPPPPLVAQAKADSIRQARLRLEKQQIANGLRFYRTGNFKRALPLLMRYQRSEAFTPEARLALGVCYLKPLNAQLPSPAKAIPQLQRASREGGTRNEASLALAQLYLNGVRNLKPDMQKAVAYLHQAEAMKNRQAAYLLGQITFYGTSGAPKNETLGIEYLQKAANAGLTDAQWTLATIYTQGTPTFPKDLKEAKVWYQKVAQSRQEKSNTL
ncbi:MAG: sel1 repeat family protein [Cytophagales bacterium]|nr:MAG: sel1 repeat family protein [Cytophagales bacterium]